MKYFIPFMMLFCVAGILNAQTWKTQIVRVSDSSKVKTIKMNSRTHLWIKTHSIDADSTEKTHTYEGYFISGSLDTVSFKLLKLETYIKYPTGVQQRTTIPPKYHLKDTSPDQSIMLMALADVDHIKYEQKNNVIKGIDKGMESLIFASLFLLALAPFISYDYKNGNLNSERYKYWALGSTMALAVGFGYVSITNSAPVQKHYQFNTGWPDKKAKVWRFRLN
jgi:hypothetical protein